MRRNLSADIWSLGGVYCEILSVSIPDIAQVLFSPFSTTPFHQSYKYERVTHYLANYFDAEWSRRRESIATWALTMLSIDPNKRPRTADLPESMWF